MGIAQIILGDNRTDARKRSLNATNVSLFAHEVYQGQIERDIDIVTTNSSDPPQGAPRSKRHVQNTTVNSKDSYVVVPSARKRTLDNNGNNHRINVVVHNITALISADGAGGDNSTHGNRYTLDFEFKFD